MFRTRSRLLLAKVESTYGVDPTPVVGSNAIEAKNLKVKYMGEKLERDNVRTHISPVQPVLGKRKIEVSFESELKGSGSAGTAPAIGALLQACGYAETVSASTSVQYAPASTGHKSVTIYVYDIPDSGNAILRKITGARGTAKVILENGKFARIEFTFEGIYNDPADVSAPSTPTFESTLPPIVQSCSFTLNSDSDLIVQNLTLDMGNQIVERDDINSATSLLGFIIPNRKPSGSFNPEAVLSATYDFFTDWKNATARALSVVVGATAGNICTITAPKVTIDSIDDGDRNGIKTFDIPFDLSANAGNDELVFLFT